MGESHIIQLPIHSLWCSLDREVRLQFTRVCTRGHKCEISMHCEQRRRYFDKRTQMRWIHVEQKWKIKDKIRLESELQ